MLVSRLFIISSLFFVTSTTTLAQPIGQTIVSAKINPLPLYAHPNDASPEKTVTPTGLPWAVKEENGDFYLVSIDGHDYWVDSMLVRASQKVLASCGASTGGAVVAAELGASTNRCK